MRLTIYTSILLLLFSSVNSTAQEKISKELSLTNAWLPTFAEYERVQAQGRSQLMLEMENDSLLLNRDDGFYTSGNHLILTKTLRQPQSAITYGWHFSQDLYTASNINLKPAQLNPIDHPYAAWLYAGIYREVQNVDGSGLRLGLDLGCLGPCAGGEWTQTNLHRVLNQPLPQAWSSQLKQEWGTVLNAELAPARRRINADMDVSSRFKLRLGNIFTDARAELSWRYGDVNTIREDKASFVFARVEVKAVAYNATLQGGYFNAQKLLLHPNRIVPEIEFGYQYRGDTWGFYASVLRRGSEIKEISNAKAAQNFAKVQVIYGM